MHHFHADETRTNGQQHDVRQEDGKTNRNAGCLPAASCHGSFPDHIAEQEGHRDLPREGCAVTESRVYNIGSQTVSHIHFARKNPGEDNRTEHTAQHLCYEVCKALEPGNLPAENKTESDSAVDLPATVMPGGIRKN